MRLKNVITENNTHKINNMKNNLKDFWRGFTKSYKDIDWESIGDGVHFALAIIVLGAIPFVMLLLLAKIFNLNA